MLFTDELIVQAPFKPKIRRFVAGKAAGTVFLDRASIGSPAKTGVQGISEKGLTYPMCPGKSDR